MMTNCSGCVYNKGYCSLPMMLECPVNEKNDIMTREEAIKILMGYSYTPEERTALGTLLPEFRMSEDERIRKQLVDIVAFIPEANFKSASREDCRTYLEKQKEEVEIGSEIVAPVGQAICIDPELINPEPKPIQKEQKQEWSEEDQKSLIRAINICISDFGEECETSRFLKSLPERFNLQPKNEWSEEDEKNLELVIDCIYEYYPDPVKKYKLKDWLKSLRPHWKPSEEQMKALQNAVALTACDKELARLYNQLKKL